MGRQVGPSLLCLPCVHGEKVTIREAVIAYARTLEGLGADPADELTRQVYSDLIAPGETHARRAEMMCMSGCALTARAILRKFILHPILEAPYRTGDAVADLMTIARQAGGIRMPGSIPTPGDIVVVGGGTDGGGTEHVWTHVETDWAGYDGRVLDLGLDGGQRHATALGTDGKHAQLIALRDHDLRDGWDAENGTRRRIRAVLDVEAIVTKFGRLPAAS